MPLARTMRPESSAIPLPGYFHRQELSGTQGPFCIPDKGSSQAFPGFARQKPCEVNNNSSVVFPGDALGLHVVYSPGHGLFVDTALT